MFLTDLRRTPLGPALPLQVGSVVPAPRPQDTLIMYGTGLGLSPSSLPDLELLDPLGCTQSISATPAPGWATGRSMHGGLSQALGLPNSSLLPAHPGPTHSLP